MLFPFLDDGIGGSPDYASCLVHSRICRSDLDSAVSLWTFKNQCGSRLKSVPGLVSILISVIISSPFLYWRLLSCRRIFRVSLLCVLLTLRIKQALLVSWTLCFWLLETLCVLCLVPCTPWFQLRIPGFLIFVWKIRVVEELVFWQSNLDHLNGRRIWFKSSAVRVAYSESFRKLVTPDMAVT